MYNIVEIMKKRCPFKGANTKYLIMMHIVPPNRTSAFLYVFETIQRISHTKQNTVNTVNKRQYLTYKNSIGINVGCICIGFTLHQVHEFECLKKKNLYQSKKTSYPILLLCV